MPVYFLLTNLSLGMCFTLHDSENYHQQKKFGSSTKIFVRPNECRRSNTLSLCHFNRVRFCALTYRWFVFLLCGIEKDKILPLEYAYKRNEKKMSTYKWEKARDMHVWNFRTSTYTEIHIYTCLQNPTMIVIMGAKCENHVLYVFVYTHRHRHIHFFQLTIKYEISVEWFEWNKNRLIERKWIWKEY